VVSLAVHAGVRAVRLDRRRPFQAWMVTALVAALAFLVLQARFWTELLGQEIALGSAVASGMYAYLLLTSLHAAHILGGVAMQALVTVRALRNDYWSLHHGQVRGTALYWHFIDAVWLVLVAFLLAIR
jgi:cytochrome c oxidase subunit 3